MLYLTIAVVLVGALCVLDLLLTLGVVRRLREHTELLSAPRTDMSSDVIAAGRRPAAFTAADADGVPVGLDDLAADALLGFFTPSCPACTERLPDFLALAARVPGGRDKVVAVVAGGLGPDGSVAGEAADLVARLGGVARVLPEAHDGPVSAAFQVVAYPSWVLMDGAEVGASAVGMDRLPSPVPA
ncbi:hypothetical protein [Pseudonocardia humida]|uniref:Thioredoxin domain-containing protein n=1 Tax=Pseudonocardia humida TaxID=2800819 RepID=A0ABT0ZSI7_9PSEU|nr:hypothetical protein [Pseudonocardia humida]MCO1653686.1 hypothetical protein [Pseudonocardia humida]